MPPATSRRSEVRLDATWAWLAAHPLAHRLAGPRSGRQPRAILLAAIAGWIVVFGTLVVWRHDRFGTYDHDLGIWDQAVWLLANGESFNTVRGLEVFGFHASPALYLFVPFYWLGGGVNLLNVAMVAAVSAGAWPVYRLARWHLANEWHALVLALAFLVNYANQWMLHETFHPEVMAISPLLFAFLAATEGRWRAYAGWLVLALAWKEDIALAGLMMGAVLAVRGSRAVRGSAAGRGPEVARAAGIATVGFCVLWFVLATRVVIPAFSDAGNFTEALFGDLGSSPEEIARTAVTEPELVTARLEQSDPIGYARELLGSFGFAALASPLVLLVGLPQMAINLLAIYDFFWTTRVHYAAMPLVATTLASVEGVARFTRPGLRRFVLGAVGAGAVYTVIAWGLAPIGNEYRSGVWRLEPNAQQAALDAAVALPGPDDAVSSAYFLAPHLGHRSRNYTFPNPWIPINWGVADENRPDPAVVDWLMVDPTSLGGEDRWVLVNALRDPARPLERSERVDVPTPVDPAAVVNRDEWELVTNTPTLLIARRLR